MVKAGGKRNWGEEHRKTKTRRERMLRGIKEGEGIILGNVKETRGGKKPLVSRAVRGRKRERSKAWYKCGVRT